MRRIFCRLLSLCLVLVFTVPVFIVPVSAAYVYKPEPTGWNILRTSFFDYFKNITGVDADTWMNQLVLSKTGKLNSKNELQAVADNYNSAYGIWARGSLGADWPSAIKNPAIIVKDNQNGIYRLWLERTKAWVVNTRGEFPYIEVAGDVPVEPGNAPANTPGPPSKTGNKFVDARAVNFNKAIVISYDALSAAVVLINKDGISATIGTNGPRANPYYIRTTAQGSSYGVFCNSAGLPYISSGPTAPSVVDNDFNIIVDNSKNNSDNVVVNDTKVIDTSNNTMTVINENGDKIIYNIDSLYWDSSSHSYTANTYNVVNNTYNYYTWNITYNVTNTYINYIGSNAAYQQEEYKYYYELPDGRSSEDLTADEVGAMSFQFADVKNYARSATDASLRALYHFDGNTEDSGYFSTQTTFKWVNNASISYMDSASFNGALYLDERSHDFDIDLPSNFGSGDFSIQWRHYQASQPDTVDNVNNRIAIGGKTVLRWDEQRFYWGESGTGTSATIPIGNWHELALVRNNGVLYFYVNGLKTFSSANTVGYSGSLMFCFGATSRAYTMLDELRVVNFAIAKAGASYQCATVPYDTNLVLVLPDSAFPIADEYWEFNTSGNIFGNSGDFSVGKVALPSGWNAFDVNLLYNADSLTVAANYDQSTYNTIKTGQRGGSAQGLYYPWYVDNKTAWPAGDYVFSVLLSDGTLCSVPFSTYWWSNSGFPINGLSNIYYREYSWGTIAPYWTTPQGNRTLQGFGIFPKPGQSVDIIYAEFKKGTEPNSGHKKVSCIYSSEEIKPNTAAVQSSIPVTGYTVGGVRPTFPARGNVWFPVEGRRITGCYIYDGSMWRSAGCRYYTGTRWIPIYAFDIYTLADCWDVADAVDTTPPITTDYNFWNWWKREWLDFRSWLATAFSKGTGSDSDCEHTYTSTVDRESTCTDPGLRTYTCTKCGHTYTELIDALGHDWTVTGHVQEVLDEEGNVVEKGYDELTCSRCKAESKDYGEGPVENDVFDALGDLIADGITWILDKLTELADSLHGITDVFTSFTEKVQTMPGEYPLFFAAFVAIIPEDLSTVLWFSVIVFVVVAVWKKWSA